MAISVDGDAFPNQHDKSTDLIKELQHAVQESILKLEKVQQKKLRVEEEELQCNRETEQRAELVIEKSGVVDVLQQLGHLLQKEKDLSEQLSGQASAERNQKDELQQRSKCVTDKARSLAAEILEVKKCLSEAKTRSMAAQALMHAPTSKEKSEQMQVKQN